MTQSSRSLHRLSRRKFVATVGALAVGAAVAPAIAMRSVGQANRAVPLASGIPDLGAFSAATHEQFRVANASSSTPRLTLDSVSEWSPHGFTQQSQLLGGEYFRLRFSAPVGEPLGQDTYQLEHDRLGSFPLFIVPGDSASGRQSYTAVIGRLPMQTA